MSLVNTYVMGIGNEIDDVKNYINDEVLSLCEKLCDCKFTSLKDMLKENQFYSNKIK